MPDGYGHRPARRRADQRAGAPTVLIASLPAAHVGDMAVCVGPPDSLVKGSATVLIGGTPAVRLGDSTAHGGVVILGCPTVLIGG
ncbi:PAAR domain-containing protein [Gemmata sp. G18]|uniref:PAAR domain-containing protein n=1 Tax=Gemmata palustris TaxID=2822762 RepID=A0ABS5BWE8_9BACT|nr:PAAR domain-containing protein [Gemmata palustris]